MSESRKITSGRPEGTPGREDVERWNSVEVRLSQFASRDVEIRLPDGTSAWAAEVVKGSFERFTLLHDNVRLASDLLQVFNQPEYDSKQRWVGFENRLGWSVALDLDENGYVSSGQPGDRVVAWCQVPAGSKIGRKTALRGLRLVFDTHLDAPYVSERTDKVYPAFNARTLVGYVGFSMAVLAQEEAALTRRAVRALLLPIKPEDEDDVVDDEAPRDADDESGDGYLDDLVISK